MYAARRYQSLQDIAPEGVNPIDRHQVSKRRLEHHVHGSDRLRDHRQLIHWIVGGGEVRQVGTGVVKALPQNAQVNPLWRGRLAHVKCRRDGGQQSGALRHEAVTVQLCGGHKKALPMSYS